MENFLFNVIELRWLNLMEEDVWLNVRNVEKTLVRQEKLGKWLVAQIRAARK